MPRRSPACALAALALACGAGDASGPPAPAWGNKPVAVELVRVEPELLSDVVALTGQLDAENRVVVNPEISGVVDAIEMGDMILADALVRSHVESLMRRMPKPEAAILGCTHYPLVEDVFREALGEHVAAYSQPDLVAAAKTEQEARYQGDAWDARIDRWLTNERRRVNHGYAGYDDWREEEVQRPEPICDVSIGEILEQALDIEPGRWTRADQMRVSAYLKARKWERYNARSGNQRAWRYRLPTWLADN